MFGFPFSMIFASHSCHQSCSLFARSLHARLLILAHLMTLESTDLADAADINELRILYLLPQSVATDALESPHFC